MKSSKSLGIKFVNLTIFSSLIVLMVSIFPMQAFSQATTKVDIFLLFDDTQSFANFAPTVTEIFKDLADGVEASLPGVDFGFGVGRFKDYGGSGWEFCSNFSEHCVDDFSRRVNGRPFYLNQPIVISSSVGGRTQRDNLVIEALQRSGPGSGGDDPESHIEALWQIVSGAGFDGNGDGALASLDGTQVAGATSTQTTPDESGDVPPFSSLMNLPSSGDIGGVGFRPDALKLIIIATEICSTIAFRAGSEIPATVNGRYSNEALSDFVCRTTIPGDDRFGFISDSVSFSTNNVANAVVPRGAAGFLETIAALNAADVRVIGMGPGLASRFPGSGPGHEPSGFLSALARITGAVDVTGNPLVFDFATGAESLKNSLVKSIVIASTVTPVKQTNEVNPSNPTCRDRELTSTLVSTRSNLKKQGKMALGLAKKVQSKNAYKKTQKTFKSLLVKSEKALKTFPGVVGLCQNTVCPATNRASNIKVINAASLKLNRSILSYIKTLKKKTRNAKKAKAQAEKQALAASQLRTTNAANVANLPGVTHSCS